MVKRGLGFCGKERVGGPDGAERARPAATATAAPKLLTVFALATVSKRRKDRRRMEDDDDDNDDDAWRRLRVGSSCCSRSRESKARVLWALGGGVMGFALAALGAARLKDA